ncbi:hypothetical protein BJX76DRAFT_10502 [Aspergillus varians]
MLATHGIGILATVLFESPPEVTCHMPQACRPSRGAFHFLLLLLYTSDHPIPQRPQRQIGTTAVPHPKPTQSFYKATRFQNLHRIQPKPPSTGTTRCLVRTSPWQVQIGGNGEIGVVLIGHIKRYWWQPPQIISLVHKINNDTVELSMEIIF